MGPYQQPTGIYALLQDLYTPEQYNPAEYTLMGYDPNMYMGMEPAYDPAMTYAQPQAAQSLDEQNLMMQELAAQNAASAPPPESNLGDYANEYMIYKLNSMGNTRADPVPEGETNVFYPEPSADKRADTFASMPISAQIQLRNKAEAYARERQKRPTLKPKDRL